MGIGFHFDDIEESIFNADSEIYNLPPISGFHWDEEETDDSPIGGLHGEFREEVNKNENN